MQLERAKYVLSSLADGVNPITGETLPDDNIYNQPDVIRALHCVLQELDRTANYVPAANAGRSWTAQEESTLLREYMQGLSTERIAALHGRSVGAIEMRLAEVSKRDQMQLQMK